VSPATRAWLAAGALAAFIVYGSLYPFAFRPPPVGFDPWALLSRPPPLRSLRGDALANLALYAPLALAIAIALGARWRGWITAVLLCGLLSATMELAQAFTPRRVTNVWDFVLNLTGAAIGATLAPLVVRLLRVPRAGLPPADGFALLLLACWLATRLHPYVPSLDIGEWRASLAPLWRQDVDWPRAVRLALLWWCACRLLEAAVPRGASLVPTMVAGVVAAAVPISDRVMAPADLVGAAAGLLLWALLRRGRLGDWALLAGIVAAILLDGLAPYTFTAMQRDFSFVPFRALMRGGWGNGMQALLHKGFLYGALICVLLRLGARIAVAGAVAAVFALGVSIAKMWLPGRTADNTELLIALAAAALAWLMRPSAPARTAG
jgi:VanZ family protein